MKPLTCNYYLTFNCNDSCEFCCIWQKESLRSVQEAGTDEIKRTLKALKDIGVPVINFTGGEPLLRADIQEILRASKRLGFFNILTTNGIEYEAKAREVTPFVDHLVFSLDWPSAEEHNRIRGTDCFNAVIEGLKTAKKLGKLPMINFTVTRDSVQVLPDMVDLSQKLGVLLWINPVYNWSGLEGFTRESIDYISRYFGRKNVALNLASLDMMKRKGNNTGRPVCRAGNSTLTVFPDNTLVSPCFYLPKSVANLDGDITGLLKRREVKHAISVHGREEACNGCMDWSYLNPSFLHGFSKNTFLALYSIWSLFWKELNMKKGANI